jgi:hypothetical protein
MGVSGTIHFLIVYHEGTQTIQLKTNRPNNGRVVLSDGLLNKPPSCYKNIRTSIQIRIG